jgi:hypothetical protein
MPLFLRKGVNYFLELSKKETSTTHQEEGVIDRMP